MPTEESVVHMPHLAYLLVGDSDPEKALSRTEFLTSKGYRCIQASDKKSLIRLAASRLPDVVLLGDFPEPEDTLNIAQSLKNGAATATIPILLTDAVMTDELLAGARACDIDDILGPDADPNEMLHRLHRLSRSSVMVAELGRRAATAEEFGLKIDPFTFQRDYPDRPLVMVVAQNKETLKQLTDTLEDYGLNCVSETSAFQAANSLDDGRFDAAVISISAGDDISRVQYLCGHIRNNPRLFNLPTLVQSHGVQNNGAGEIENMDLYRGGASIVLSANAGSAQLCTYLQMLVNRQRMRWTLRDPFKATLAEQTADSTGVAYSDAFWIAHLKRCVTAARKRGNNMSLAVLSVPTLPRIREEYDGENAEILAHQLADWMTGMTRIEDTVARIGPDTFAILLPDTELEEANRVTNRIIGILEKSEFHLGEEIMQGIHAWVQGGVANLEMNDTAATLQSRARVNSV